MIRKGLNKRNKKLLLIILLFITLPIFFTLYRLEDMRIRAAEEKEIEFSSGLSASLYLPDTDAPYKVIIFIHGDGPADRTLDGGYNFIINRFLDAGYACFSYDKAGVSKSKGNWLNQTMKDRAKEIEEAIPIIKETVEVESIGTLAFSQGAWVTSELALMEVPLDFHIVIGGAIDWMEQHMYFEKEYAKSQAFNEKETTAYLDYVKKVDSYIMANDYESYLDYVQAYDYESPMTEERFHFVYLNYASNAKEGIPMIKAPFLGVFGDSDTNVDVFNSMAVYESIFESKGKSDYELHLIKDANHELLSAKYSQKESIAFYAFLYGDGIFAEGALDLMIDWLNRTLH